MLVLVRSRPNICLQSLWTAQLPICSFAFKGSHIKPCKSFHFRASGHRSFSGTASQPQPPHQQPQQTAATASQPTTTDVQVQTPRPTMIISNVSDFAKVEKKRAIQLFAELSKARLGALVVASTIGGFLVAPVTFGIGSAATLVAATVGTSFCVASANTINQVIEVRQDTIMKRTLNRPIAAGLVSRSAAFAIGIASGGVGVGILYVFVNPLTAGLGFMNILLYTCAYTPMKQVHYYNTWVGALVGAIPPMMGWTAATNALSPGSWVLFALLYLWQIPHFFSLSWLIKEDYANAGFRMLVCEDPVKMARLSLAYSLSLLLVGPASCAVGMTDLGFLVDSTPVGLWLTYEAFKFKQNPNNQTARRLFLLTLAYLPILMGLMVFHKKTNSKDDTKSTNRL